MFLLFSCHFCVNHLFLFPRFVFSSGFVGNQSVLVNGYEMGNNSGKKQCGDPCQKDLDNIFNVISVRKNYILRSDLKRTWYSQIDRELYDNIEYYLFKTNNNELSNQSFKRFFLDLCKGDIEKKIQVLNELLGDKDKILGAQLLKFIISILNSIIIIQEEKSPKRFNSWSNRTALKTSRESLNIYANYFLIQTQKTSDDEFTKDDFRSILVHLEFFLLMILSCLYETEDKHFYTSLLPKWKYTPVDSGRKLEEISVLDLCKIMFINLELPIDFQHEWRILFSTSFHGESFSKLSAEIVNKGPTIIIVKDKEGYIFGGFAPCSWNLGPAFFGDSRSFLFTLYPKMNLYVATNFNNNYQYMNVGQQTMPNGLGMGGRLEYFGLWLNAEFGKGYCSESCTTYRNYKMMSSSQEFDISHLEVWGVGPPPPTSTELGERSVLDGNLEAQAILEMTGKNAYSKGLRDDIDN